MSLFTDETESVEESPGRFRGRISGNWSVNGNPNGGYLMGIMVDAALRKSEKKRTPIVTANFISRGTPGTAQIVVEKISHSRQFQRFQVSLFQEGEEKVRALATFSAEKENCPDERYETGPAPLPSRDRCVSLPDLTAYGLFRQVELLLDPSCAGWLQKRLSERSENRGWMRLRDDHPYDIASILLVADALPPGILASRGMVAWVPTIELSVSIRNMPKSRWLNCSLRTRFVTCGLLEADGEVWDEKGNLVAISRQIAQVRTG
ncbi:MAG: thioesterase family protein [Deltaproteobacteria bacterium]|nr:thioesterase family protein [Deltaproteobacteria bacterium]